MLRYDKRFRHRVEREGRCRQCTRLPGSPAPSPHLTEDAYYINLIYAVQTWRRLCQSTSGSLWW